MKASVKLWAGFRMCRVVVFGEFQTPAAYREKPVLLLTISKAIGTIMSMALSVLYAVLLLREWNFYSNVQRMSLDLSDASNINAQLFRHNCQYNPSDLWSIYYPPIPHVNHLAITLI